MRALNFARVHPGGEKDSGFVKLVTTVRREDLGLFGTWFDVREQPWAFDLVFSLLRIVILACDRY